MTGPCYHVGGWPGGEERGPTVEEFKGPASGNFRLSLPSGDETMTFALSPLMLGLLVNRGGAALKRFQGRNAVVLPFPPDDRPRRRRRAREEGE